jgi:hypothetical protein
MSSKEQSPDPTAPNESRRKLLRIGLYVAPAVIATLIAKDAGALPGPCGPSKPACSCAPSGLGTSSC